MAKLPLLPRPKKLILHLLLDEGVPNAVGKTLEARGHKVTYGNNSLPRGSADQLVCVAALNSGAILVAADHDMKRIAKSHGASNDRFKTLSLIKLSCKQPEAAEKIAQAIALIETEWLCRSKSTGRRLWVEIQPATVRFVRDC